MDAPALATSPPPAASGVIDDGPFPLITTIAQEAYLKASDPDDSDYFGLNVAVSGAAYVFTRTGATWEAEAYLKPSNTGRRAPARTTTRPTGARCTCSGSARDAPV